jgi:hypothetical protein
VDLSKKGLASTILSEENPKKRVEQEKGLFYSRKSKKS